MKIKQLLVLFAVCAFTASNVWGVQTYSVPCPAGVLTPFALQVYATSATPLAGGEDLNTVLNTASLPDGSELRIPNGACPDNYLGYTIYYTDMFSPSGWDDVNGCQLIAAPRMKPGDGAFFIAGGPAAVMTFTGYAYGEAGEPAEPLPPPAVAPNMWSLRARQTTSFVNFSINKIMPSTASGFAVYFGWNGTDFYPGQSPTAFHIFEKPSAATWTPFQPAPTAQPYSVSLDLYATNASRPVWVGPLPGSGGCSPAKITGIVWGDNNGNGIISGTEPRLPNQLVNLNGTVSLQTFTDDKGKYSFIVPPGNYTINTVPPPCMAVTTPGSIFYTVNGVVEGQLFSGLTAKNFGVVPLTTVGNADLSVQVYATYAFASGHQYTAPCPGTTITYHICYRNNCGSAIASGATLKFVKQTGVNYGSGSATFNNANDAATWASRVPLGNTATWTLPGLPAGAAGIIIQKVNIPSGFLGPSLSGTATIFPLDLGAAPNTATHSAQVTCSFDPNDKAVTPKGCGPEGFIPGNQTLTYDVHFQNLGSAPAFDVVVHDRLDDDLDAATLELLGASHNYVFSMTGRDMVWKFLNIYLPDATSDEPGSHGFFSYRARPLAGLPAGTVITNQAAVYFDLNAPIYTPTTTNTITTATVPTSAFTVSPRPGSAGATNDFSYTGGTPGATFLWDFGADAMPPTSTNMNPAGVVFPTDGQRNINLQVSLGGCDSAPAVATLSVGVPQLDAALSGGQICLTWQGYGYSLQATASLQAPVTWQNFSAPVTVVGGSSFVCVPATNSFRFYRLRD